jgi:hypothetical protein
MTFRLLPRPSLVRAPRLSGLRPVRSEGGWRWLLSLCLLLLYLGVGCEVREPEPAAPPGPRLYPVHGTITVDGKPLAGAVVAFVPSFSDRGTHSVGETRADGSYELVHRGRPGAARGDYRVVISYIVGPDGGKPTNIPFALNEPVPPPIYEGSRELVPPRYSNFSKTELRAIVEPGGPPIDFALKGPLFDPPVPDPTIKPPKEPSATRARRPTP